MDSKERRRKLRQAYEVLCLSNEIIMDVLNDLASDDTRSEHEDSVRALGAMTSELDEIAADLSMYTMDDSAV